MARFIRFPWATTGDRAEVPFGTDPGGSVSYSQGFGPDYEIAPGDPGWKPVPREETNGLYYDLTDNLRQYQLNGAPDWHPAADNGGVAISYPVNAVVRYNDLLYRSIAANNTATPGTDITKWVVDGLAGPATTTTAGLVRLATLEEAAARVINDAAVTPLGLSTLFDLFSNQPVFPEVDGAGTFTVTSPSAGNIQIAAGTSWTMRGAFRYTSALTNLTTLASKTYHLRWDKTNGFALYDLSNGAYNPSAVPETSPTFDSTYDSVLVARVVTSAANAATITVLVNKARLAFSGLVAATNLVNLVTDLTRGDVLQDLGWARTPGNYSIDATRCGRPVDQSTVKMLRNMRAQGSTDSDLLNGAPVLDATRYRVSQTVVCPTSTSIVCNINARA